MFSIVLTTISLFNRGFLSFDQEPGCRSGHSYHFFCWDVVGRKHWISGRSDEVSSTKTENVLACTEPTKSFYSRVSGCYRERFFEFSINSIKSYFWSTRLRTHSRNSLRILLVSLWLADCSSLFENRSWRKRAERNYISAFRFYHKATSYVVECACELILYVIGQIRRISWM